MKNNKSNLKFIDPKQIKYNYPLLEKNSKNPNI